MVTQGSTDRLGGNDKWDVEYDPSDGKFYDVGSENPYKRGEDNTGTNSTAFPTTANMETHYWYDSGGTLNFQFDNPYYVA